MRIIKSKKHSYYISTLSISLVLFLLGAVSYIGYMVTSATDAVTDDIKISLLLVERAKSSDIDNLMKNIREQKLSKEIEYISKEKAAEQYKVYTGEDFSMFIDDNPIPASLEITLTQEYGDGAKIDSISTLLAKNRIVDEVVRPQDVVDQVFGYIYKVKFILYSFIFALFCISVVLINNAIKMNIRSKRFLIKSMKLIGATDTFIIKPFIGKALGQGFNASFFAWLMLIIMFIGVNRGINGVYYLEKDLIAIGSICIMLAIVGMVLSVICTSVALQKEINQNMNKLHTY